MDAPKHFTSDDTQVKTECGMGDSRLGVQHLETWTVTAGFRVNILDTYTQESHVGEGGTAQAAILILVLFWSFVKGRGERSASFSWTRDSPLHETQLPVC